MSSHANLFFLLTLSPTRFDNIKSIVEELNREPNLKINKIVNRVNSFIRRLRSSFLEQAVRTALKNWDS